MARSAMTATGSCFEELIDQAGRACAPVGCVHAADLEVTICDLKLANP